MYLGFGVSDMPQCFRDKVIGLFGHDLLESVLLIVGEVEGMEVDWSSNLTLKAAGELVMDEMQNRHPELDKEALDALVWKYTFDWR